MTMIKYAHSPPNQQVLRGPCFPMVPPAVQPQSQEKTKSISPWFLKHFVLETKLFCFSSFLSRFVCFFTTSKVKYYICLWMILVFFSQVRIYLILRRFKFFHSSRRGSRLSLCTNIFGSRFHTP